MTPYFEEDGITIYHGDCREVLPMLLIPGIIITDPPYNIGYHYDSYKDSLSEKEYCALISNAILISSGRMPCVVIHYPEDMFWISSALGEPPEKCVAWIYNANTSRQWRMIAWFRFIPDFSLVKQPYKNPLDSRIQNLIANGSEGRDLYDWWNDEQVKNVSEEKTEHPCQIPIALMNKVLSITPCELVYDPFMGSGTTLRAAKDLGRRAIGIEIEEKYCEIAAKRLSQKVFQF